MQTLNCWLLSGDIFAQSCFTSFFFFFSALSPFTIDFESEIVWHWSTKGHTKSGIAASWHRWYWTNNSPVEAGVGLILPYNYFRVANCITYQHIMYTWLSRLEHSIHCDLLWGCEGLKGGNCCLYKLVDMGFSQAAYVNKLYRHGFCSKDLSNIVESRWHYWLQQIPSLVVLKVQISSCAAEKIYTLLSYLPWPFLH